MQCIKCKGRGMCGKPCPILSKLKEFQPKIKTEFSGSSPPEIFVGRFNYPDVYTGILAPAEHGDTEQFSMPEIWHSKNFGISEILAYRSSMIYSRFKSNIKSVKNPKRFLSVLQETAMTSKAIDMEFKLNKRPSLGFHLEQKIPLIGNPAPLRFVRFQENVKIEKKIDYIVNDVDMKSLDAMYELYNARISTSNIIKILSAGLLGIKKERKLVPTRWAITATDSNLSDLMLKEIRYFPLISNFFLFNAEYLGNHYEIIFLPSIFSFEVLEAKVPGSVWNPSEELYFMCDYESWYGRKNYATNVTGGYYAVRLSVAEYLKKIKKQASVLVLRECRPEYWAPCGVGILRECTRSAFQKQPEKFSTLKEALQQAQKRMKLPIEEFIKRSILIKEFNQQKRLSNYF
ncbi:MAG: Nre family DNA repair protein [Candidatus Pacearchaeota archaeon]